MVICEKGNGLEKRIKIQGNGRTCNLKATSGAACIHKDRDLPTQGQSPRPITRAHRGAVQLAPSPGLGRMELVDWREHRSKGFAT